MTPRPYTLVAELTHRCPLACPYCSNPVQLARKGDELTPAEWRAVLDDAAALGVLQAHFSGGEPLAYAGLAELVAHAESRELYTHLVTSGLPRGRARLPELLRAGLAAVQLSFQGAEAASADAIAGVTAHEEKLDFARAVRDAGLPLTMNVVLHAANVGHVQALVELGLRLGAERLELANAQYLGWALGNRATLLPTHAEIEAARAAAMRAKAELHGRMEILFVLPDYLRGTPRACMDGWARRFVHVAPDGVVLPCHAAMSLPEAQVGRFESVRARPLREQWPNGAGLERFRGTAWMAAPCMDCERRELDFGGCRCQAYALTGDAARVDPACRLSPDHHLVAGAERDRTRRYLFRGRGPSGTLDP